MLYTILQLYEILLSDLLKDVKWKNLTKTDKTANNESYDWITLIGQRNSHDNEENEVQYCDQFMENCQIKKLLLKKFVYTCNSTLPKTIPSIMTQTRMIFWLLFLAPTRSKTANKISITALTIPTTLEEEAIVMASVIIAIMAKT